MDINFCINKVWFTVLGYIANSNMHFISTSAAITPQEVLQGKFPGIFLNPLIPWTEDKKYCVGGTKEQYEKFYKEARDAKIDKEIIRRGGVGLPVYAFKGLRAEIENQYKDWWDEKS